MPQVGSKLLLECSWRRKSESLNGGSCPQSDGHSKGRPHGTSCQTDGPDPSDHPTCGQHHSGDPRHPGSSGDDAVGPAGSVSAVPWEGPVTVPVQRPRCDHISAP